MEACPGCGREFGSPMAVTGHQRACPGRGRTSPAPAPRPEPRPPAAAEPEASAGNALAELLQVRKLNLEIEDLRERREREARQELERKAAEGRALAEQRAKDAAEEQEARRRRRVEDDERRDRERQERAATAAAAEQRDREQREQLAAQRDRATVDNLRALAKVMGTEDRLPGVLSSLGLAAPPAGADQHPGASAPRPTDPDPDDAGDAEHDYDPNCPDCLLEDLAQLGEDDAGDDVDD